jgi:hypothetical protein
MGHIMKVLYFAATLITATLPVAAQDKPAAAPTTVGAGIDGASIILEYGRPKVTPVQPGETNKLWAGVVPYNKVWAVGSGRPARLISDKDLVLGRTIIPAGTNALYVWIGDDGTAKLVISKQLVEGETGYDPAQDLARVDLEKEDLGRTVDQLTMVVAMEPAGGGRLKIMLEKTQYSVCLFVRR